jgi:hypothetical protein
LPNISSASIADFIELVYNSSYFPLFINPSRDPESLQYSPYFGCRFCSSVWEKAVSGMSSIRRGIRKRGKVRVMAHILFI